jgi:hypothetical protein
MNLAQLHCSAAFATMQVMNRKLHEFLHALTTEQQAKFAELAESSVGSFRHYVSGRRQASAGAAIAMEKAANKLRNRVLGVPELDRGDLCSACKTCEYRKRCVKEDSGDSQ